MDDLLARAELKVDEKDLIREVAIFAERSDIAEEVTRLSGHLEQFERILACLRRRAGGPNAGFFLDPGDAPGGQHDRQQEQTTPRSPVRLWRSKGAIDRIKEQVQNVE